MTYIYIYIYISILEYHEDRMAYEINHMMLGFVGWVLQFLCSIHPAKILLISLLGQIWCFFAWRPFVAAGSLAPNTPFPSKHFFFFLRSFSSEYPFILSYFFSHEPFFIASDRMAHLHFFPIPGSQTNVCRGWTGRSCWQRLRRRGRWSHWMMIGMSLETRKSVCVCVLSVLHNVHHKSLVGGLEMFGTLV